MDELRTTLRRTAPAELLRLHAAAASWYAQHGDPIEAVRHAQAAGQWNVASADTDAC